MKRQSNNNKTQPDISWLVKHLLAWFRHNARDLPWRRDRTPYAVWVSEIMLQQTQVKTVIPFFERWMRELPTIAAVANAPSQTVHKLWEGLGYYTRVRNMQRAAQVIVDRHSGEFPMRYDDVLALPGIGRYTAGAICSLAFNQATPIVDGNVIRVLTRFFGIKDDARASETRERLWRIAGQMVECAALTAKCSALNEGLMEIGALICTPRAPACDRCPVAAGCAARAHGLIEVLPNLGKRPEATQRRFVAALVQRRGQALIRQRPVGVVNAHLWEFPNAEVSLTASDEELHATVERELGCRIVRLKPFTTIKHAITRYRITLEVFEVELNGRAPRRGCSEWKGCDALGLLPFTSAHGKIRAKWLSSRHVARK